MTTTTRNDSPRSRGENPRAQGTNPRAVGESPRQQTQVTRADLARVERKVDEILRVLGVQSHRKDGPRALLDGTRFMPGTGLLDQDPARPRSPEVQAVIDRDERERQ